ncbi:hypothetical protein [Streptomyces sp. NPDC059262]
MTLDRLAPFGGRPENAQTTIRYPCRVPLAGICYPPSRIAA